MNINDFLNKRILARKVCKAARGDFARSAEVGEFTVIEVSPSSNFVKLMNLHGQRFWKPIADIDIVEELE